MKHIISENDYIVSNTFFRGIALEKYITDNGFELDVEESKKRIFKGELDEL